MLDSIIPQSAEITQALSVGRFPQFAQPLNNQAVNIRPMDYRKVVGARIRETREAKGWILEELSRRTNDVLSLKRISEYELGKRMPRQAEAVILAKALGVRAAYLMALDDTQILISPQEEVLVKNWRRLPENERMSYFRKIEQTSVAYRDTLESTGARPITPKIKKAIARARKGAKS